MQIFYVIFLLVLLLSACGLKGPLYIPQDEPPSPASLIETKNK
ncbi:MAG: lipoprotein [Nitrosomonas sp.]|nr:lipoprotein [Nitrosomonas sp.]MDP1950929.1 lipoprotein [Nitrosomonas sp.]